jgi:hypothetical protein
MKSNYYLEEIIMETSNNFECLLIKANNIDNISWLDSDYPNKLANLDIYESITTNKQNFIEILATKLNIKEYNIKNLSVKTEIIAEESYYLYELLYIDLNDNKEYHIEQNFNGVASLLNINEDKIFSNALLFKNYFPSLTDSMTLISVTTLDIQNILYNRVNTKIVIWDLDNKWKEIEISGDLSNYANIFFENYDYKKIEFFFLMHNINIWYIDDDYGEKNICGSLIKNPLEKCLWFTLKSDELRGNLTLNEIEKIIYLSTKLSTYCTPSELLEEKIDIYGRKIINNKYKILDLLYNKYL